MAVWRLFVLGLMGASMAAWGEPRDYRFEVSLDEREIGNHSFTFEPLGDRHYRLTSEASYDVKLLFVTVYEYRHRSEEEWRDGCLVAIRSATDDNGNQYQVVGERVAEGFRLQVNGEQRAVGETCVRSFAYWNPELLRTDKLLNSQTGKLEEIEHEVLGTTPLPWQGERTADTRKLVTADGPIELWYGAGDGWLGLRSQLKNGRVLQYRPSPETEVALDIGPETGTKEWNL